MSSPASGSLVLAGFPPDECAALRADLVERGIAVATLETPFGPVPAADLVVVDARFAADAQAWRSWLARLHAERRSLAIAGRLDEIERAELPELHLPIIERPCAAISARPWPGAPGPRRRPSRAPGRRVLAVDDNEINRLVLADMLAQEGARVTCLAGGHEAIAHLTEVGPDSYHIVLTDIQMPDMDGYALTLQLRADYPRLPVLGLTAHAGPEARDACLAAGMRAHLPKPLELDDLVREILEHACANGSAGRPPRPGHGPSRPGELAGAEALFKGRPQFVERVATRRWPPTERTRPAPRARRRRGRAGRPRLSRPWHQGLGRRTPRHQRPSAGRRGGCRSPRRERRRPRTGGQARRPARGAAG
jgi:CheY-like chemotaxis protein